MSESRKGVQGVDWTCSDPVCKNVNYARRTHCHRCKLERKDGKKAQPWEKKKPGTEIGKQAADKSRGLFSAEDWQCSQCANINWSRRSICNMCNAPKFTKSEERTGTGGGFNDRVAVEYKEKVESDDDEYDEFGRRKKLRGGDGEHSRNSDGGNAEEDEESGDEEGDLSKYNLWDSDDEEPGTAAAPREEPSKDNNASTSKADRRSPPHSPRKRRKSSSSTSSSSSASSSSTSSSFSSSSSSPGRKYRRTSK